MENTTNLTRSNLTEANETIIPAFTNYSLVIIIPFCMCFLVGAVGNLMIFITLSRGRHRKSRISLMICHLSVADLVVIFIMIPVEVGWRITVEWVAGNMACKILLFLRAFGLYLSSNILICISVDRYFAVMQPLNINAARRRGKIMLTFAWIYSIICAAPQSFIYQVESHPLQPSFKQCTTIKFFESKKVDKAIYNIFCIMVMYFVPLAIITWVYIRIFCEINSKTRESKQAITRINSDGMFRNGATSGRLRLRRSDMTNIERARSRTLWMTIIIVAVFILCWTPYIIIILWYIVDRKSAELIDQKVHNVIFVIAVAKSCANPLIYGSYMMDFKKEFRRCFLSRNSSKTLDDPKTTSEDKGSKRRKMQATPQRFSFSFAHNVRRATCTLFKGHNETGGGTPLCTDPNNLIDSGVLLPDPNSSAIISEKLPLHELKLERPADIARTSNSNTSILNLVNDA